MIFGKEWTEIDPWIKRNIFKVMGSQILKRKKNCYKKRHLNFVFPVKTLSSLGVKCLISETNDGTHQRH